MLAIIQSILIFVLVFSLGLWHLVTMKTVLMINSSFCLGAYLV